jgi:2-dehydropantoate 2-reductase
MDTYTSLTATKHWPRVAVVGAGAVGGYFGGVMADAGAPVVMIGRKSFVHAVSRNGLLLDTLHFRKSVIVEASTDLSAVRGAQLVLFCVKTTDNTATARELAPYLAPDAIVISMQNGVDNVEQIRAASNIDALPAAVYVAVSAPQPGQIKHVARGDIVVGPESERTLKLAEILAQANIPCRITENIEGELWTKLIWNCALNAISALGLVRYGRIVESLDARELVRAVLDEVLAVARASNIVLPGIKDTEAAMAGAMGIATQMSEASSSTAQDINRAKRTEIDSLNGFIARRGAALDVPTPVNHVLFTLVKLVEERNLHAEKGAS